MENSSSHGPLNQVLELGSVDLAVLAAGERIADRQHAAVELDREFVCLGEARWAEGVEGGGKGNGSLRNVPRERDRKQTLPIPRRDSAPRCA